MALTVLKRDPYGRRDLMRQSTKGSHDCAWCGRHVSPGFRYAWVGDAQHSSRVRWSESFCSVGCWRAYADE